MTNAVINLANTESGYIYNSVISLAGAASNTGAAYGISFSGTGEDFRAVNVQIQNAFTAFFFGGVTISGTVYYPGFLQLIGCTIDGVWGPAVAFSNGTATTDSFQVAHLVVQSCSFTGLIIGQGSLATYFSTGLYTKHILFTGNIFRGIYGSATQIGINIGANADFIFFGSTNLILNETGDVAGSTGISISSSALGVYGLENLVFKSGDLGTNISDTAATILSATTTTLPLGRKFCVVTGTTTIQFTGNLTFTDGSNLKLAGNLVSGAGGFSTITLRSDGTNWIETARAIN